MKKIAIIFVLLAQVAGVTYAQRNTREEIMADIEKAGGVHYMYPTDQPIPTEAPKGYKPFYVSHVGRHGARFALGSTVYTDQWKVWSMAHDKGWLTPEGEAIFKAFAVFYPQVQRREGNLTQKGQEQHRFIASQLYYNYPEVFKGETRATAVSTGIHRVIVSMFCFLDQLEQLDKDFSYQADYGYPYQGFLLPDSIDASRSWPKEVDEKYYAFRTEKVDANGIMDRWFSVPSDSLGVRSSYSFCRNLHTVVSTLDNLDIPAPEALQNAFTPEERYHLWEVGNYSDYLWSGMSPEVDNVSPMAMKGLLRDILDNAEQDWANGIALRLRFAHDSTLMPLLSLMDVNGMGVRTANPLAVENAWRSFDIPMACNLQLVFFRSKKNPDILVQVLLNGFEATLPLQQAAPGFYKWEDIKALYIY